MKKAVFFVLLLAVLAAAGYWWFLGSRTHIVEGVKGPANSVRISAKILAELPLASEFEEVGLDGRVFRTRYWDIKPGGIVPLHSHRGRPATIYVVNGEMLEYANGADTPKRHRGGEISIESEGLIHHWRNDTDETVNLVASDIYLNQRKALLPKTSNKVRSGNFAEPKGMVTYEELALVDLSKENIGVTRGSLRTRRIVLGAGAVTQVNAQNEGPVLGYLLQGKLDERRSDAAGEIKLKPGDQTILRHGVDVQWLNVSASEAVLLVSDIPSLD